MGYDHFFHFIKDDLIDPNIAFIQNVDNFLFCIYFGYLERYKSDMKKERNILLADLFRNIKSSLMDGVDIGLGIKKINTLEKEGEILKEDEKDRVHKITKLDFDVEWPVKYPTYVDKLIELKFNNKIMNYAEMQVDLILYCILVNGLDKTKGEKFDQIKEEMQPLIKILKEIFCEFDKNKIHKERTFIFPLRSPVGTDDEFYIINNKEDMLSYNDDEDDYYADIKCMFLYKATNKDKRKNKYYNIVLGNSLHGGDEEYKL